LVNLAVVAYLVYRIRTDDAAMKASATASSKE
jgi:hypothetical protein